MHLLWGADRRAEPRVAGIRADSPVLLAGQRVRGVVHAEAAGRRTRVRALAVPRAEERLPPFFGWTSGSRWCPGRTARAGLARAECDNKSLLAGLGVCAG